MNRIYLNGKKVGLSLVILLCFLFMNNNNDHNDLHLARNLSWEMICSEK